MSNQERQTIARLKGRIAYLQEALAQAKAEIMDYRENHQHQKELSRLESENAVLKELLAKYEKVDLEQYEAVIEENKKLKKKLEQRESMNKASISVPAKPLPSADDWFINNLKSQSSTKQDEKKEER